MYSLFPGIDYGVGILIRKELLNFFEVNSVENMPKGERQQLLLYMEPDQPHGGRVSLGSPPPPAIWPWVATCY